MAANGKRLIKENSNKSLLADNNKASSEQISVSFKYFKRDLEDFELGEQKNGWFISVLDRLTEYTKRTIDEFREGREQEGLRLHEINWEKSSLKRSDFTWLPENVLNDKENFPFRQIDISMGEGRMIFFMYDKVAFILLFDPKHNMQLCKKHKYKVKRTWPALSEIDVLKSEINKLRKKKCDDKDCPLDKIDLSDEDAIVSIDKDLVSKYNEMVENGTLIEAFEDFLISKL